MVRGKQRVARNEVRRGRLWEVSNARLKSESCEIYKAAGANLSFDLPAAFLGSML